MAAFGVGCVDWRRENDFSLADRENKIYEVDSEKTKLSLARLQVFCSV